MAKKIIMTKLYFITHTYRTRLVPIFTSNPHIPTRGGKVFYEIIFHYFFIFLVPQ